MVYDSEEEAEEEKQFNEEQRKFSMNGKQMGEIPQPEEGYDANVEVKKVQKYKAAPGVKFVEFDEYGMNKKEGLGKYISTDTGIPDVFIEAPAEMYERATRPKGVFRDYDKEEKELTTEGKSIQLQFYQNGLFSIALSTQIKTMMPMKNSKMILCCSLTITSLHYKWLKLMKKNGRMRIQIKATLQIKVL